METDPGNRLSPAILQFVVKQHFQKLFLVLRGNPQFGLVGHLDHSAFCFEVAADAVQVDEV